jgi:putative endonuclease
MNHNQNLGNQGELLVVDFLQKDGFAILHQNYRKFFGEIDIIAYKKNLYVFVEVKTRSSKTIPMSDLITPTKQKKIIKTAESFIAQYKINEATYRFDVALLQKKPDFQLTYIPNAFTKVDEHAY